jgi:hypothetical protein
MTDKPYEFGLLISKHFNSSNELRVSISVVRHDSDGGKKPDGYTGLIVGSYASQYPKGKQKYEFGQFEIRGHVRGDDPATREVIGFDPEYWEVYAFDQWAVKRFAATFRGWEAILYRWREANPSETFNPVTAFNLLAKFVGAKWVVYRDYAANKNCWQDPVRRLSLKQGAYQYARVIEEWKKEYRDPWRRAS